MKSLIERWNTKRNLKKLLKDTKVPRFSNEDYLFFAKDLLRGFVDLMWILIIFAAICAGIFYSVIWLTW